MLICFCDGSISQASMGLGVVVCRANHIGERIKIDSILYVYKKKVNNIGDTQRHYYEFFSILESLEILKSIPQEETIVFNDCTNTIELLERISSKKKSKKFKSRDFFLEKLDCKTISHISFQWAPRANAGIQIADKLSKVNHPYLGNNFTLSDYVKLEEKLKNVHFYKETWAESVMHNNLINKWLK